MHRRYSTILLLACAAAAAAERPVNPCTRRTALAITEVMYHPAGGATNPEFVELHNTDPVPADLSGCRLAGAISFVFPANTVLDAGAFLAVAANPAALQAAGITNAIGPLIGDMPDDKGTVQLFNRWGAELLRIDYADNSPWPVAADGAGHSLTLVRPDYGEADARAWAASSFKGGSPGRADPPAETAFAGVVINEFLAHTDPDLDKIEIYNGATQSVDLSGGVLTDDPDLPKFILPTNTFVAAGGFLALTENDFGFRLSMSGESIFLMNPAQSRVIDAVRFAAQERGVATGRYPDGAPDLHELTAPTLGFSNTNAELRIRDVVINEIMYRPISGSDEDEYIELFNRGSNAVDMGRWQLGEGVNFLFPPDAQIPAGGYLVIARDAARLRRRYAQLNAANTLGDYSGRLSDRGERIVLLKPDNPALPYQDLVVVDEVAYSDGWGKWTDGGGSSLELTDPRADNRLAANWAGSDETRKGAWTTVACTGVLANGSGSAEELNVLLLGAGECLVDGIEMIKQGETANRVAPAEFAADMDGWTAWGNHVRSSRESAEGYGSAGSLHVRASDGGRTTTASYPLGNYDRIWKTISPAPVPGETFTLRAKARWLRGWPYMALSVKGFWIEAAGALAVPVNLGTPGLRNSRFVTNAPPAIWDLSHAPALPARDEPVTVSCRVHDPDGVASVALQWRADPSNAYTTVPMSPQPVGGDGLYRAVLPGLPAGQLIGFRVVAVDGAAAPATNVVPDSAPMRDALVRFGETHTNAVFGRYTLWISDANVRDMASRSIQSNEPVDGTFVGEDCRIIYNAAVRYRGNFRAFTNITDAAYSIEFPRGERLLGAEGVSIDIPSLQFPNGTFQQERHAYWIAGEVGHPASHVRYVRMHVNGSTLFRHDLQVAGRDFARSWYGDDDPAVHKEEKPLDPFARYVTPAGVHQQSTYRFVLEKGNTAAPDDDYRAVFRLVDALNGTNPTAYAPRVSALVDPGRWAGYFAINHAVGNVDSYGYGEAFLHNLYAYIPPRGRSALHLHDMDSSFASNDPRLFPGSAFPVMARLFRDPLFERAYWRVLADLAAGPMAAARSDAALDARRAALLADGIPAESPDHVDPNTGKSMRQWIADRRDTILQQLAATNAGAAFAITTQGGADFTTGEGIVTLQGAAPVHAERILLNGIPCRVVWESLTGWRLRLGLAPGTNVLDFAAVDRSGSLVGTDRIAVTCTASNPPPEDSVLFSEIMYHPPPEGAEFVELHNRSPDSAFDLGGWRVNGLDFTFDRGSILEPGGYAVIVASVPAYASVYSNAEAVLGEYAGNLDNGGGLLRLERPAEAGGWSVVDEVQYDDAAPWSADADGRGPSLQLLDPRQDNDRIGNWQAVDLNVNRRWTFVSTTGRATSSPYAIGSAQVRAFLNSAGAVCIDGLSLVQGSVPETGSNHIANGDFETALAGPWSVVGNHVGSGIVTNAAHTGTRSLELLASSPGSSPSNCVRQGALNLTTGLTYTLSYWFYPARDVTGLTVEVSQTDILSQHGVAPEPPATALATPGASNSLAARLPPFPMLWINEIMPSNINFVADNRNEYDPWIELYLGGTSSLDLAGCFLSNDPATPGLWAFPTGLVMEAGTSLVVWADGETSQTTSGWTHAAFRLNAATGCVTLARDVGGSLVILDALSYAGVPANSSYGSVPDGDPRARQVLHYPTPAATNRAASMPAVVRINEWMADNTATLADPADGKFQDWFELYNPDNEVDLSGYWLTDDLAVPRKYPIPGGTRIPAGGFLLLWADAEPSQNQADRDVHADFKLERSGEAIGLFAPDGTLVDAVQFGPQRADRGEGRWPDGSADIHPMARATPGAPNVILGLTHAASFAPSSFEIGWMAESGRAYRVMGTESLPATNWFTVGLVTAQTTAAWLDDPAVSDATQRFYRILTEP